MAGVYYEKIAHINLTTGDIKVEQLDLTLAHEFIGGRGLGAKILYDEGVAAASPLSPENKLLCVTGPLTGTVAPSSGRYALVTKSPDTGKITSSNSGGIWGVKLKYAGWDAIIIEGEAKEWTYISIEDSAIRLYDAREYVGVMTTELDEMLKARHGADASVLSIGPAGEKQILLASVMNDKIRAAGRGGIGAVMGSKRLKAIVVKASRTHMDTIADLDALRAAAGCALNIIRDNGSAGIGLNSLSTETVSSIINCVGSLPVRSWCLSGSERDEKQLAKPGGCYRCPVACRGADKTGHETQHQCSSVNVFDQCSMLCNEYGLDAIGVQRAVAAAVELHQQRKIKENECGGIPLEWNHLAEWTKRIGNPKTKLDWIMSSGADHLYEYYSMPELYGNGKTSGRKKSSLGMTAVIDSMGQCVFPSSILGVQEYTNLLNAAVGTNCTAEQVLEIGERIRNVEQMFNDAADTMSKVDCFSEH